MPEPTNTPSAPSCIIIAASAGVARPPAVNSTTGSLPAAATSATSSYGACSCLAAVYSSLAGSAARLRISARMPRMCRVASTTLPVPASPALGPDIGGAPRGRHPRDRAGVRGDLALLRGAHTHDPAPLEHVGHAALPPPGPGPRRGGGTGRGTACGTAGTAGAGGRTV